MRESLRSVKAEAILTVLRSTYPEAKVALEYRTPMEMLVSTVLSAQCTDKRVNMVTKHLFKKYRSVKDYACAEPAELEKDIRSTGFYRQKAGNIIAAAGIIMKKYRGRVPDTMEALTELPGVARKTANIVLLNAFGKVEGIAVDTHVRRLSLRLGLAASVDPVKIEQELMAIIPKKRWAIVNDLLVAHGRQACFARKPACRVCRLNSLCPSRGKV